MCPGNKRDRQTLEKIILDNAHPGTTNYTDYTYYQLNCTQIGLRINKIE